MHQHIKTMTEVFEALAVFGDPVSEEDQVVHLLANLPGSYEMLVTALDPQSESVPKWELATERLRHEKRHPSRVGGKSLLQSNKGEESEIKEAHMSLLQKKPGY